MGLARLSKQHKLFVEAYIGDTVEAMQVAGFQGTPAQLKSKGEELLIDPLITEAINARVRYQNALDTAVATRQERQKLWTNIMRNEDPYEKPEVDSNGMPKPKQNIPLPVRLKATELLGKSEQDFVEKIDINGSLTITDVISKSYKLAKDDNEDPTIEEIEAEYYRAKDLNLLPDMPNEQPLTELTIDELI